MPPEPKQTGLFSIEAIDGAQGLSRVRAYPSSLHLELLGDRGIRLTARDGEGAILWGFIVNPAMLGPDGRLKDTLHVVAVYEALARRVREWMEERDAGGALPRKATPVMITDRIDVLIQRLERVKKAVSSKKATEATMNRVDDVVSAIQDCEARLDQENLFRQVEGKLAGQRP